MIEMVGKHTVKLFDRNNNLVDQRENYNVITTKGRERILDIWAENFWSSDENYHNKVYGFEEIDLSPTVIGNGDTRLSSFFDIGKMHDPQNLGGSGSHNFAAYNSWIDTPDQATTDKILWDENPATAIWDGGPGDNGSYWEYWHGIDLNRVTSVEEFTIAYSGGEDSRNLYGNNLKYDYNSNKQFALKVTNQTETVTYSITSDYTFDREAGTIIFLESGSIPNSSIVKVTYKWHDTTPFDDGIIGMYFYNWPRHSEGTLYWRSWMGPGRYSVDAGDTWEYRSWPWWGKPHHNYRAYWHDSSDILHWEMYYPRYDTEYGHYFFTHPYIINKPTNFAFNAGFNFSPLYWKKWRFLKPKHQPQVPQVIALGTGTTTPTVGDTTLANETARWNIASMVRPENSIGCWRAFVDYDEQNGVEFKEVGMFYGDEWRNTTDAGWTYFAPIQKDNCDQLFSRTVYDTPWTKTADNRAELTYEILMAPTSSSSSSTSSSSTSQISSSSSSSS